MCTPSFSVYRLVQQLKGKTLRILFSKNKELKRRYRRKNFECFEYFRRSVRYITIDI